MSAADTAASLGPMPTGRAMETVDERVVRSSTRAIFELARDVVRWPSHLGHYRYVRLRDETRQGLAVVEMSAYRPFGPVGWPTWWLSLMEVFPEKPAIRFRHIGGITEDMDVEWSFESAPQGTRVTIVHAWDGPRWPLVGAHAARLVIGPVFIHGIASRTLTGLARAAERGSRVGAGA